MSPTRFLLAAVAAAALWAPAAMAQTPAPAPAGAAPAPAAPMVAKSLAVQGDMMDSLKLNGGFNTFIQFANDTNLASLFKANKNLTVFVPTDAAFAAMPPADLAKLKADKTAARNMLAHHIINLPWPSAKIKGVKGPIQSGLQDNILLDGSDEGGTLKVDGATIIQPDVQTASGLVHVVDHVLIAGQGAVDPPAAAAAPAAPAASAAPAKQ